MGWLSEDSEMLACKFMALLLIPQGTGACYCCNTDRSCKVEWSVFGLSSGGASGAR